MTAAELTVLRCLIPGVINHVAGKQNNTFNKKIKDVVEMRYFAPIRGGSSEEIYYSGSTPASQPR